jgi:AcrR family transcriptional regulator
MKDTKENILKTAYDLFLSSNYEAVTINNIIEASGLTKGGIYHYFSSKEEIFKAVVDRFFMENKTEISKEHASLKDLIDYNVLKMKKMMQKKNDHPNEFCKDLPLQFISLMITAMRYFPDYVEKNRFFYNHELEGWKKTLKDAMNNGEIRTDMDIDSAAQNFLVIGTGLVPNMIFSGSLENAVDIYERQLNEMYKMLKL